MTTKPEAVGAMTSPFTASTTHGATVTTQSVATATRPEAARPADLTPAAAWSRRVRRIGGLIQAAFAAFWLARASLAIGGRTGDLLITASGIVVIGVFTYAIRATAGTAPRPAGAEARRIERSVTIATVIELVAAFVLPVIVIAVGRSDWVLPSIVITIGPLLLYLDHLVHIPRYRVVGWALTAGPVILVATMSGSTLAVTTGFAAGVVLLGTAAAGFHDLAAVRRSRSPDPARTSTKAR
jgi:hypothetical protein